MAFSRPDYDEDSIKWNTIRARLEDDDGSGENADAVNLAADDDDDKDDEEEVDLAGGARSSRRRARPASRGSRRPVRPMPRLASPEVAEKRLPRLKAAAARVNKLREVAVDPARKYKVGQRVFDPTVQKFGEVVTAAEGYVRIRMRDGSESAHGRPPLDDRKNFVLANFDRMDNKTMAEILGISVHTMRRLCHDYGLKRQGRKKPAASRKTA